MVIIDKKIKVSVVMATYNGSQFVEEQILSIVNQTYPIYELIIQDDCSTDNTWEILQQLKEKFPVIQTYRNEKNFRAHETFKKAFLHATGDYIAPSDQDDIWELHKIETMLNLIGYKKLIASQSRIWYANDEYVNSFSLYNPNISIEDVVFYNNFPGHALMFHKSYLESLKVTQGLEISFDHTVALCAVFENSYVVTDKILQTWRRHDNVCTRIIVKSEGQKKENRKGYQKLLSVFLQLAAGKKSSGIKNAFQARKKLIQYLLDKNQFVEKTKIKYLLRLAGDMEKQNVFSYVDAGIVYDKIVVGNSKSELNQSLKKRFFNFKYPFVFWYDMHLTKTL